MIGYGGTEAPRTPPASVELYSFKRAAEDIKELARQLGASRLILGGHDWVGPNHPSQIVVCVCGCDKPCIFTFISREVR
jgi:hypothetical protein